jgi:hypothetical protein
MVVIWCVKIQYHVMEGNVEAQKKSICTEG